MSSGGGCQFGGCYRVADLVGFLDRCCGVGGVGLDEVRKDERGG
jgi:hypothetical protein